MATDVRTGQIEVNEFRENLEHILESDDSISVTHDGEVIGVYTPVAKCDRAGLGETDRKALRTAGEQVDAMLAAAGITEEEAIREAEQILRSRKRKSAN